jgi:phage baseplate assembly protein gpV
MHHIAAAMRTQALMAQNSSAATHTGTVSSYDPASYSVKVLLHPDNIETNWLPLLCPWVGNGWGMFAPPSIGDMIEVAYVNNDPNTGIAALRFYNDINRPLPVPSGEFWLVHQSGSALKFHNDGSVEVISHTNLTATVGGALTATVGGALTANVTGSAAVTVGGTTSINSAGDVSIAAPHVKIN